MLQEQRSHRQHRGSATKRIVTTGENPDPALDFLHDLMTHEASNLAVIAYDPIKVRHDEPDD